MQPSVTRNAPLQPHQNAPLQPHQNAPLQLQESSTGHQHHRCATPAHGANPPLPPGPLSVRVTTNDSQAIITPNPQKHRKGPHVLGCLPLLCGKRELVKALKHLTTSNSAQPALSSRPSPDTHRLQSRSEEVFTAPLLLLLLLSRACIPMKF